MDELAGKRRCFNCLIRFHPWQNLEVLKPWIEVSLWLLYTKAVKVEIGKSSFPNCSLQGPDLVLAKNLKTTVQKLEPLQAIQLVGRCLKSISVTLVETVHKSQQFLIGSFVPS